MQVGTAPTPPGNLRLLSDPAETRQLLDDIHTVLNTAEVDDEAPGGAAQQPAEQEPAGAAGATTAVDPPAAIDARQQSTSTLVIEASDSSADGGAGRSGVGARSEARSGASHSSFSFVPGKLRASSGDDPAPAPVGGDHSILGQLNSLLQRTDSMLSKSSNNSGSRQPAQGLLARFSTSDSSRGAPPEPLAQQAAGGDEAAEVASARAAPRPGPGKRGVRRTASFREPLVDEAPAAGSAGPSGSLPADRHATFTEEDGAEVLTLAGQEVASIGPTTSGTPQWRLRTLTEGSRRVSGEQLASGLAVGKAGGGAARFSSGASADRTTLVLDKSASNGRNIYQSFAPLETFVDAVTESVAAGRHRRMASNSGGGVSSSRPSSSAGRPGELPQQGVITRLKADLMLYSRKPVPDDPERFGNMAAELLVALQRFDEQEAACSKKFKQDLSALLDAIFSRAGRSHQAPPSAAGPSTSTERDGPAGDQRLAGGGKAVAGAGGAAPGGAPPEQPGVKPDDPMLRQAFQMLTQGQQKLRSRAGTSSSAASPRQTATLGHEGPDIGVSTQSSRDGSNGQAGGSAAAHQQRQQQQADGAKSSTPAAAAGAPQAATDVVPPQPAAGTSSSAPAGAAPAAGPGADAAQPQPAQQCDPAPCYVSPGKGQRIADILGWPGGNPVQQRQQHSPPGPQPWQAPPPGSSASSPGPAAARAAGPAGSASTTCGWLSPTTCAPWGSPPQQVAQPMAAWYEGLRRDEQRPQHLSPAARALARVRAAQGWLLQEGWGGQAAAGPQLGAPSAEQHSLQQPGAWQQQPSAAAAGHISPPAAAHAAAAAGGHHSLHFASAQPVVVSISPVRRSMGALLERSKSPASPAAWQVMDAAAATPWSV